MNVIPNKPQATRIAFDENSSFLRTRPPCTWTLLSGLLRKR